MKKGVKPDGKELKMGSYKLLTGTEKLLALDRNLSAQCTQTGQATHDNETHLSYGCFNGTREKSLPLKTVFSVCVFNNTGKTYQ